MKVGDLVKWTHPQSIDFGLVLQIGEDDTQTWINRDGEVLISWLGSPERSGFYPSSHELLEIISESR